MDLSPLSVALSAAVLLVNAAISLKMDLGLHWQLGIASLRCVQRGGGWLQLPVASSGMRAMSMAVRRA